MNNVLTEKQYQRYTIDRLVENGYIERKADNFDSAFAIDRDANCCSNFFTKRSPTKWRLLKRYTKITCAKRL